MNTSLRQKLLLALACCVLTCAQPVAGQQEPSTPPAVPEVEAPSPPAVEVESREESKPHHHGRHGDSTVVHVGSDSYLPAGSTADSVVSVGGSSTSEGEVRDTVTSVMGNTRVTAEVGDSVSAIMGNVYVDSKVGGDVVAVFGDVELGPNADVYGDVVSVGGTIIRDANAKIHGDINEVSIPIAVGQMEFLRPWVRHALLYGRPLATDAGLGWAWALALGFLAFYVLLAVMFPAGIRKSVRTLEEHPGMSFLTAFLSVLITPMLILVLLITVIGIAVLPFLWLGLCLLGLFGKAVILAAIGGKVLGGRLEGPPYRVPLAVLIGGAILLALYVVPIIGNILYFFTGFLGFGVAAYALLIESKAKRAPSPTSGAGGPAGGTGPGGIGPMGTGPSATGPLGMGASATSAAATSPSSFEAARMSESAEAAERARASAIDPSAFEAARARERAEAAERARAQVPPISPRVEPRFTDSTFTDAPYTAPTYADPSRTDSTFTETKSSAGAPPPDPEEPSMNASTSSTSGNSTPPPPGNTVPLSTAAVSLPRASFAVRMGALAIDLLLVSVIVNNIFDHADVFSMVLVPLAIYGAAMWKLKGATIGAIVCNMQVVRLDGREIDWATAIVRALGCFLSFVPAGLGFFWMLFDSERQTWHDKIAGTVVVRVPKGMSLV